MIDEKYYERYNPGQGVEQNHGITPEMYKDWKTKKHPAKEAKTEAKEQPRPFAPAKKAKK